MLHYRHTETPRRSGVLQNVVSTNVRGNNVFGIERGNMKEIFSNKVLRRMSFVIVLLVVLLGVTLWKYENLRAYTNEVIERSAWNFAAGNHSLIELYNASSAIDYEHEEAQTKEIYYDMQEYYTNMCKIYQSNQYSQFGAFDNEFVAIFQDGNRDEIIRVLNEIESILQNHQLDYLKLVEFMESDKVNYNKKMVREWDNIIDELNRIDFYN